MRRCWKKLEQVPLHAILRIRYYQMHLFSENCGGASAKLQSSVPTGRFGQAQGLTDRRTMAKPNQAKGSLSALLLHAKSLDLET